ncbi:MAG: hypothetical protein KC503_37075, partial [Myxococcales bacterium]|nr:hypothetical protein [Myxococcales bacterium]
RRKRAAAAKAAKAAKARQRKSRTVSVSRVLSKYRRVKQEYQRFARSYGARLQKEWNAILFANTFQGRDSDKYRRLDRLLDQLRRKMARIRNGG